MPPRGVKSPKRKRQYEKIKKSAIARGRSPRGRKTHRGRYNEQDPSPEGRDEKEGLVSEEQRVRGRLWNVGPVRIVG